MASQYRVDEKGNVYRTITGASGKQIELKLTPQAAQRALENQNVSNAPTSTPKPTTTTTTVPTPTSSGYQTINLGDGQRAYLNDKGEIWQVGGTLSSEQLQQLQGMNPQQQFDYLRDNAQKQIQTGNVTSVQPFIPGQGTVPAPPTTTPTTTPTIPSTTVPNPYASLEYERAQRERAMNEAINRLQTDYNRLMQNIQQDRTLENLQLARNLNPFSGRSDYAWGIVNMERARTDRERQEDLENRIAAIRGGYLDFVNAMPGLEREYQDQLAQRAYQNALQYAQLFGYLPGSVPTPFSGLNGVLPNFTGGGGNAAAPLTLSAQNQLFNQAMALREFARANEAQQAALSGRYMPQAAQPLLQELLSLKQAAEQPGVSREQMAQYRARADQIRQDLALMGVDPSLISADVPYSQAVQNIATGYPTYEARMAQQRFDAEEAQRLWENTFAERQFDFKVAQQLWENQFQERNFEQAVKEQAQKMGLEWSRLNQQQQQFVAELAYKEKALQQERELKEAALALEREQLRNAIKPMSASDYKTNPDFAQDVQYIKSNPKKAMNDLKQYAAQFIQAYGYDGYRALINELPKKERDELLGNLDEFYP